MSSFGVSRALGTRPDHAPTDSLDAALDHAIDGVVDASQALMIQATYESIPVASVRVAADPATGPRAWRVDYDIVGADAGDHRARPPIQHFAITRNDREGPALNAAELDVLALELDTLAADRTVPWKTVLALKPDGSATFHLTSAFGVSGTPRDRLTVDLHLGSAMRMAVGDRPDRALGALYRLLDVSAARFAL